jgi:hypothetical protein
MNRTSKFYRLHRLARTTIRPKNEFCFSYWTQVSARQVWLSGGGVDSGCLIR